MILALESIKDRLRKHSFVELIGSDFAFGTWWSWQIQEDFGHFRQDFFCLSPIMFLYCFHGSERVGMWALKKREYVRNLYFAGSILEFGVHGWNFWVTMCGAKIFRNRPSFVRCDMKMKLSFKTHTERIYLQLDYSFYCLREEINRNAECRRSPLERMLQNQLQWSTNFNCIICQREDCPGEEVILW